MSSTFFRSFFNCFPTFLLRSLCSAFFSSSDVSLSLLFLCLFFSSYVPFRIASFFFCFFSCFLFSLSRIFFSSLSFSFSSSFFVIFFFFSGDSPMIPRLSSSESSESELEKTGEDDKERGRKRK